jgi:DNA-binding response OmpR family regulator
MRSITSYELARRLAESLESEEALRGCVVWISDIESTTFVPVVGTDVPDRPLAGQGAEAILARGAIGFGEGLVPTFGYIEIPRWSQLTQMQRASATQRIERAAVALADAEALGAEESATEGTILVVDDDPAIRTLLRTILGRRGYRVLEAGDGAAAIAQVERSLPDLVIMDWEMPTLNGRDAAAALKANPRTFGVPIVMLTSRSQIDDKVDALEIGVQDFVTKPFDLREFVARIEQQMRWRRLLDAQQRGTGLGAQTPIVAAAPADAGADALAECRRLLAAGDADEALSGAMALAERSEEQASYERAAQAYALAAEGALVAKNPDVSNKLQRLSGKMYLLLAENAGETEKIQLGYSMAAKMFLAAGNLKLAREAGGRNVTS